MLARIDFSLSCSLVLTLMFTLLSFGSAIASECVSCHTDAEKLKSITKLLPKKEKSAETAGKG